MAEYSEKESKSILNTHKNIDSWFWSKYTVNPYNGCEFACIYCDSRSEKYHLPEDFGNMIVVKKNAAELLDKKLTNARLLKKDIIAIGGTTDPYQPAEGRFQITRSCLEVLRKHQFPALLTTKSVLVLKDLELIRSIAETAWCTVSVTITSANPLIARFLEPNAPPPGARFDIVRTIKNAAPKVQSGILMMPAAPYLCDSDENLENMVRLSKESGADYIILGGLTLRDRQADWYLRHLAKAYPAAIRKYEALYGFQYPEDSFTGSYNSNFKYTKRIYEKFMGLTEKYNMPYFIQRYLPNDLRAENYKIAGTILMESFKQMISGNASQEYFWAGQSINNLEESIVSIYEEGRLSSVKNIKGKIKTLVENEINKLLSSQRNA